MRKELEKDIQKAICEKLSYNKNILFWRSNNIPVFDPAGKRFRAMPKFAMKGIPDIIVVMDGGYVIFIEVKRKGGKLSPDQIKFQQRCKELGAEYYVITSVDQLKEIGL